jgi:hypothetical protein
LLDIRKRRVGGAAFVPGSTMSSAAISMIGSVSRFGPRSRPLV